MNPINFQNVRIAIGDRSPAQRSNLIHQLKQNGFDDILQTSSLKDIVEAVEFNKLDLVVCSDTVLGDDFCDFVSDVRHSKLGNNPFLVIIATIDMATESRILKILNSGVDDLLAKPLSSATLAERIINITRKRKPFSVTSDYIGPDRRPEFILDFNAEDIINTPNTLNALTQNNASHSSINKMIQKSLIVINEQKMEHHAVHITKLVQKICNYYYKKASSEGIFETINTLIYISEDIQGRLKGTRFSHVAELCRSMGELARRIQQHSDAPDVKDIQLLPEIGNAIKKAFDGDTDDVARARDISMSLKV